MATTGERLAEGRRAGGKSITDAERATKIRAKYLRALEEDDYSLIPDDAYARGFLKNYAEYLGLPAGELLRQHRVEHPSSTTRVLPEPLEHLEHDESHVPRHIWRWVAVGVAVAVVVWVGWGLISALMAPKSASNKGKTDVAGKSGRSTPARPSRSGSVKLSVSPRSDARPYVEISVNGRVKFGGNLTSARRYTGREVRLRTMFPDQIVLVVDKRRVTLPSKVGAPYDQTFKGR